MRDRIRFYREFYFIEPGGRDFRAAARPAAGAPSTSPARFCACSASSRADKMGIARALVAMRRERTRRKDLDRISMLDWLLQKRQTPRAIDRFWRQVLVSAVNEDLDRMAAVHGFQVFWLGFLARADAYEMGIPAVPLGQLYTAEAWQRLAERADALRAARWSASTPAGFVVAGERRTADYYICALPFERLEAVGLPAPQLRAFAHHRRAPVVRPRGDHAAARHAARPHHAVDVQQGRRPVPATGGQRVARSDRRSRARRSSISRSATCGCISRACATPTW